MHTSALRYAKYVAKIGSAENKINVKLATICNFFSAGINSTLPLNVRNAISLSHSKILEPCPLNAKSLLPTVVSELNSNYQNI